MALRKTKPKKQDKPKHHGLFDALVHGASHGLSTAAKGTAHVATGTSKGFYHGVTGLPTGAYMMGRAIGHDIRHDPLRAISPGYNLYRLARGKGHTGKLAHAIAKAEYEQYRHFGRGGDISGPLLDAAALISAGGSLTARTAKAIKEVNAVNKAHKVEAAVVLKRAGHPMPPEDLKRLGVHPHEVEAVDKTHGHILYSKAMKDTGGKIQSFSDHARSVGRTKAAVRGFKQTPVPERTLKVKAEQDIMLPPRKGHPFPTVQKSQHDIKVSASVNPLARGFRTVFDKTKPQFMHEAEFKKEMANRQRQMDQARGKHLPPQKKAPFHLNIPERIIRFPMDLLRAGMVTRPRYYAQNIFQTGDMLAHHPIQTARSVVELSQDAKLRKLSENVTGGGRIEGAMEGGGQTVKRYGHWIGKPENKIRRYAFANQLRIAGITPEQFLHELETQGLNANRAHQIMRKTEEEVGAFGRLGAGERAFTRTQIPIFYPMYKALSRYAIRYPLEHPIHAATRLALGKQGHEEQQRLLGPLPYWGKYLIPLGAGDPNAKRTPHQAVLNPGNIFNLQPATDLASEAAEMLRHGGPRPGVNFLQEAGPMPNLVFAAITGHDLSTGYPLKGLKNHSSIRQAVVNYLLHLPEISDVHGQKSKTFEEGSRGQRLFQWLAGPGFVPRNASEVELKKQAKREATIGQGKGKHHHKKKYKDPY